MLINKKHILLIRNLIIAGLFIYTILPFLVLMLYNHPSSDDFTYSNIVLQKGFFAAQKFWYQFWTGRYTATAALSLNPLILHSFTGYKFMALLILSGLLYSFYFLIDSLTGELSKKDKWLVSFLFMIVYLYQMPSSASGIYWFAAVWTYQLANIFTFFMFGHLIKYLKKQKKRNLYLTIVFLFLLIGGNETSMIMVDIILFIILILYHFSIKRGRISFNKKNQNLFFIIIVAAVIFSLFSILSPGNGIRANDYPGRYQLSAFKKAFNLFSDYWIKWTPFVFLISLLVASFFNHNILSKIKQYFANPFIAFLLLTGIVYIGFFPAFWSMGNRPPFRAINVIYLFYVTLWFYFVLSLFIYLQNNTSSLIPPAIIILSIIVSGTFYLKKNNVKTAYDDWLSKRAEKYDIQMTKRYQMIEKFRKNHNSGDTLIVPRLKSPPKTIFFKDITPDNVKNWRNASYAKYFHISAIKTQK